MKIASCTIKQVDIAQALTSFTKDEVEVLNLKSWRAVFEAVQAGEADYGVVPADDTSEGTFYEIFDLFQHYTDTYTVAELDYDMSKHSHRRFFVIGPKLQDYRTSNKSSMIFVVSHKPGSLYKALAIFENYELNLTKIESRRVYGKDYEYVFYVDFEYTNDHKDRIEEIIAVYKENTQYLRIVGFYKSNT